MEDPQDRSVKDPKKQTAAQRGAVPGFWIPTSPEDWHQLVLAAKLTKETINTLPAVLFGSGSVASHSQYLMMRAFSPVMEFEARYALTTRMKEFGFSKGLINKAAETLKESNEWRSYLAAIETNTRAEDLREGEDNWPGALIVPLTLQQQTTTVGGVPDHDRLLTLTNPLTRLRGSGERDTRESQLPEAEDEMVVNAASVTFLQALSQLMPSSLEWVFNRLLFHPQFALGGYKTFTDGALRCRAQPDHIFAILEVKRRDRHTSYAEMVMQETCELVGWLLKSSSSIACFNGHSLMVSQDRDGLYLTFTPFNEAHQRYLVGEDGAEGFLRMETFGPFKTNNDRDMALFGSVILAAIEIAHNHALDRCRSFVK